MAKNHGRETATDRAARKWAAVERSAAAYRNGDGSRQDDFWRSSTEEKAYLAGFVAGCAYTQARKEKDFEQGYAEAVARFSKGSRDSQA